MARLARWTSSAPAQALTANARTLITMPSSSMVATMDEFTVMGMPRYDGVRFKAYADAQHPESLDISWAMDVTMPATRRPLVSAVPTLAGQTLTAASGGLLTINAAALGANVVGASVADGGTATYVTIDYYVGDPAAQVVTDGTATIRGGVMTCPMSSDGPRTTRISIERANLNPGSQWLANGMRLYLTSPIAGVSVALRIVNIRQVR